MKIEDHGIAIWREDGLWHVRDTHNHVLSNPKLEFTAKGMIVTVSGTNDFLFMMPSDKDSRIACDDSKGYIACVVRKK